MIVPMSPGDSHVNGKPSDTGPTIPPTHAGVDQVLTDEPMTTGYKPQLPYQTMRFTLAEVPPYYVVLRDVESMLHHPHVRNCLRYYCNGIWPAKFQIKASSPEIEEYVHDMLKRWWARGLRPTQWYGYAWGWVGGELCYAEEKGRIVFDQVCHFAPWDVRILSWRNRYMGVRVRSGRPMNDAEEHSVDLWGPSPGRPSKSLWFVHDQHYGNWHGWTQLYGGWLPWRRLAYPNGGQEALDGGMYRFAYGGIKVRHPKGSDRATRQPSGEGRQDFRDKAIEMANNLKAGGNVAFTSERDDKGHPVWDMEPIKFEFDPTGCLDYIKYLKDEIASGIGTPTEIMEPGQGGAGYSGADIRKEAYYVGQQYNAEAQVRLVREHWLDACVVKNFGPDAWYDVEVMPLLESQQMQATGMAQMPGAPGQQPAQPGMNHDGTQSPESMDQSAQGGGGFDISSLYQDTGMQNMALDDEEVPGDYTRQGRTGRHSPAGGIVIGGHFYNGGEFIPGAAIEEATPEERKHLEAATRESYYADEESPQDGDEGAPDAPEHSYGAVLLKFEHGDSDEVKKIFDQTTKAVREEDLDDEGVEDDPHVTVLFGLSDATQADVQKAAKGTGPITVKFGPTDAFSSQDADAVFYRVESAELTELHKKLSAQLPHIRTHDEYQPHVTIAYLKPGKGDGYKEYPFLEGQQMTFNALTFSDERGEEFTIPLSGEADAGSEPSDAPAGDGDQP